MALVAPVRAVTTVLLLLGGVGRGRAAHPRADSTLKIEVLKPERAVGHAERREDLVVLEVAQGPPVSNDRWCLEKNAA